MTEEEAKKKWCPFSRYPFPCGTTGNRGFDGHMDEQQTHCIGFHCMAWRIREVTILGQNKHEGYCGLAEKP